MTRKKLLLASAVLAALPLTGALGQDAGNDGGNDSGAGGRDPSVPAQLVPMEAIELPIIDGARVQGTLHFQLVLEAGEGTSPETLASDMPFLRAAALAAGAEFARLSASPFVAIDAQQLSNELTSALRARQAGIARVLLVEVTARSA